MLASELFAGKPTPTFSTALLNSSLELAMGFKVVEQFVTCDGVFGDALVEGSQIFLVFGQRGAL